MLGKIQEGVKQFARVEEQKKKKSQGKNNPVYILYSIYYKLIIGANFFEAWNTICKQINSNIIAMFNSLLYSVAIMPGVKRHNLGI